MPDKAVIYEKMGDTQATAFVIESSLKVMLEEDYLALKKNQRQPGDMSRRDVSPSTLPNEAALNVKATQGTKGYGASDTNTLSSKIIREVMIPILQKEVNEGENFAPLRQVYNSILLALWYKQRMQGSILQSTYVNHSKIVGVDVKDKAAAQKIWRQYVRAYKKGVVNLIKEEQDPITHEIIPRKYFAGGFNIEDLNQAMVVTHDPAMISQWLRTAIAAGLLVVAAACGGADILTRAEQPPDASSHPYLPDAGSSPHLPDAGSVPPPPPIPTPTQPSPNYKFDFKATTEIYTSNSDILYEPGFTEDDQHRIWAVEAGPINISRSGNDSDLNYFDFLVQERDFFTEYLISTTGDTFLDYFREDGMFYGTPIYRAASFEGQRIFLNLIGWLQLAFADSWWWHGDPAGNISFINDVNWDSTVYDINAIERGMPQYVFAPLDPHQGKPKGTFITTIGPDKNGHKFLFVIDSAVSDRTSTFVTYKLNFSTGEIDVTTLPPGSIVIPHPVAIKPDQLQEWTTTIQNIDRYFQTSYYDNYPGGYTLPDSAVSQLNALDAIAQYWLFHGFKPDSAMVAKKHSVKSVLTETLRSRKGISGQKRTADQAISIKDRAMNTNLRKGGIDLTKNATPLDVRHSGDAVRFHIDPAQIAQINAAPGLMPEVFSIKRLQSLPEFLGLNPQETHQITAGVR